MISAYEWHEVAHEVLNVGALTNSLRGAFNIPQHLLFPTFRIWIPAYTSGDVTAKLRFGFTDADLAVATLGIDFTLLGAVNLTDTRSPVWISGAAAPNFTGNSNSILPPRCRVLITTNGVTGFVGTYSIYAAGIIVP